LDKRFKIILPKDDKNSAYLDSKINASSNKINLNESHPNNEDNKNIISRLFKKKQLRKGSNGNYGYLNYRIFFS